LEIRCHQYFILVHNTWLPSFKYCWLIPLAAYALYINSVNGQPDELVDSQARVFIKPGRIVLLAHKSLKTCMLNIYLTGIMKTTRTGFSYIAGVFYNKWKRKEKDQMINRSVEMWGFLEDCNLPSMKT
jgi:hypothetical protein